MTTKTQKPAMLRRKLTLGLALGASLIGAGAPALAQTAYPTKPVTLMVGFPPGGQTDFAARVLSNSLAANLGQSVVIENKAGVNGNLGSADIMRSAPDGYRITPHDPVFEAQMTAARQMMKERRAVLRELAK